jgi:8-oxo-dGTP pyrophosphatase MutT (NUDIX family)
LVKNEEILAVILLPNGKIVLIAKSFYPKNTYRLPTGGIEKNESIEEALVREVREETGIEITSKTAKKFLAKVVYNVKYPGGEKPFTTHIFLVKSKNRKLKTLDREEEISGFKEIKIEELPEIAEKLRKLPKRWREWGNFRAVQHEVVYKILQNETNA